MAYGSYKSCRMARSEESRLLYLLSGSCEVLPSSYIKLRSYLNIHSAEVADRQNFSIFKNRTTSCPYCYSSWTCDTSSFKLLPSKKLKAQIKKRVDVKPGEKEAAGEPRNVLVLKCKVCTRKSSFSLVKKKYIKEKVRKEEENVKLTKKKKKKKDRSCGLLVNLEKTVAPPPQPFALKKKAGLTSVEDNQLEIPPQKNSQKFQSKPSKNLPNPKCRSNPLAQASKRLIVNPFAPQAQNIFKQRKKVQKLKELKKAVKGIGQDVAKKTLKDFLTLI